MVSQETASLASRAKEIYSSRLQAQLEATETDRYVAIEPDSEAFFVADSFSDAVAAARAAHPDKLSFVIRVGHAAALHIGGAGH